MRPSSVFFPVAVAVVLILATPVAASNAPAAKGAEDVETAVRLFDAQKYAEARTVLESAVLEHPGDARAAEYLGRVLFEESQPESAARSLERAAAADPSSSSIQYWLGRAYGEQAIRGNLLLRAKLAGRIRHAFERAVELDPASIDARVALLEFYLRAPSFMGGSLTKAGIEAEEIRRRNPFRGHRAVARIHESRKRYDLAAAEYEAAAKESPARPEPYYWMEQAALDRKDWKAGFDAMARLSRALPGEAGALYETGRLAALSGRELDRGEADLRKYLETEPRGMEPPLALARLRLAEILEKRGDRGGAREEYREAIRLDPGLTDARLGLARLH